VPYFLHRNEKWQRYHGARLRSKAPKSIAGKPILTGNIQKTSISGLLLGKKFRPSNPTIHQNKF